MLKTLLAWSIIFTLTIILFSVPGIIELSHNTRIIVLYSLIGFGMMVTLGLLFYFNRQKSRMSTKDEKNLEKERNVEQEPEGYQEV